MTRVLKLKPIENKQVEQPVWKQQKCAAMVGVVKARLRAGKKFDAERRSILIEQSAEDIQKHFARFK